MFASEHDAHIEWHLNAGVPLGTPGCPQDACHYEEEGYDYEEDMYYNCPFCGTNRVRDDVPHACN